jgi:hypothetical protein
MGYFRGFTGFLVKPESENHGGPGIRKWMIDMGYGDLR